MDRECVGRKDENEKNQMKMLDQCDKYDYIIAAACGVLGGMIDILFVGTPEDSTLDRWTDKQTDKAVMAFAKKLGWKPSEKNSKNVNSAIGFLEQKFKVNYDQRKPSDVNDAFNIAPKTHHMMSLAHSPDIVGLFFSILNQFTSTSTFITDGKLITISTETFELQGHNFPMKLLCGIANWFGHLASDVAGSSGSHGRGTGIVMPFYELLGLCKFGSFSVGDEKKDLADIAMKAFTEGYDFRFGMAQAIPVFITEACVRFLWAVRRRFQYRQPMIDCIPTKRHPDLRMMLLLGDGSLCLLDGADAAIRAHGDFLQFFMRFNLVAWYRFALLAFKEVCKRLGISDGLEEQLEACRQLNLEVTEYLAQLQKLDIQAYEEEVKQYASLVACISSARSDLELNGCLLQLYDELKWDKPWKGDFNVSMGDENGTLHFS